MVHGAGTDVVTVNQKQKEGEWRFPGQLFDGEPGFHYNYFRDYDPSTGHYIQSDTIGLEGTRPISSIFRGAEAGSASAKSHRRSYALRPRARSQAST